MGWHETKTNPREQAVQCISVIDVSCDLAAREGWAESLLFDHVKLARYNYRSTPPPRPDA